MNKLKQFTGSEATLDELLANDRYIAFHSKRNGNRSELTYASRRDLVYEGQK